MLGVGYKRKFNVSMFGVSQKVTKMENRTTELEDEVHEKIVEAIDTNKSMDDLKKMVGQTYLKWYMSGIRIREQARRKFFELRKAKREEKPGQK